MLTCSFLAATTTPSTALAAAYELNGFAQASYGVRAWPTSACTPARVCRFTLGEERLQLKFQGHTEGVVDAAFTAITDFVHDDVLGETRIDPRELYVELSRGPATLRMGRQVITWGTGDLFFVNDIFPKDWESFYLGRPFEYFKVASDGLRLLLAPFDAVLIPRFSPDGLPSSARFLAVAGAQPQLPVSGGPPPVAFRNMEAALRAYGSWQGWDGSLYLSKTFYRAPAFQMNTPDELHMRYPRLIVFGGSLVGPLLGGVINFETGLWYSWSNRKGIRGDLPFTSVRSILGYAHPLWEEATLSVQLFGETILQYSAYRSSAMPGQPLRERVEPMASVRFTQTLLDQTLQLNLLAVYALSPSEGFVNATVRYSFNDAAWAELGTNLFGGDEAGSMGMFRRDSSAFLNVRYAF
ncbi:MAG: hypothetical protein ACOY0T_30675 [Myxococcota bacterium]